MGDLAYAELLSQALPLLSDQDREIIELSLMGFAPLEMAHFLSMHPKGTEWITEERVVQASSSLAQACRTVAAARSLLGQATGRCRTFADFAAERARIASIRDSVIAHINETVWRVQSFDRSLPFEDRWYIPGEHFRVTRAEFNQAKAIATEHLVSLRRAADQKFASLDRDDGEIVARAAKHATTCPPCQQEVTRTLGRDWSPF